MKNILIVNLPHNRLTKFKDALVLLFNDDDQKQSASRKFYDFLVVDGKYVAQQFEYFECIY